MNPVIGDWEAADVLVVGSVVVGVGPGLLTAAADDKSIVIDCRGTVVLPAGVDFISPNTSGTLRPGAPANIAVVRLADLEGTPKGTTVDGRTHLDILILDGRIRNWNGRALDEDSAAENRGVSDIDCPKAHPYLGFWVDENDFLRQELLPDGRYDEARGDCPSAYQGRYWIDGTRIDYLDDLGFWAYGEFRDGVLHHAGYRLTRR